MLASETQMNFRKPDKDSQREILQMTNYVLARLTLTNRPPYSKRDLPSLLKVDLCGCRYLSRFDLTEQMAQPQGAPPHENISSVGEHRLPCAQ